MSVTKDLPCPFCRAPIRLRRAHFFPSRRSPILCSACGSLALLPWKGVLVGLTVMIGSIVPALLAIKPLFAPGMETVGDFAWAAAALLAVAFGGSWAGSWACAQAVQRLAPYRARP